MQCVDCETMEVGISDPHPEGVSLNGMLKISGDRLIFPRVHIGGMVGTSMSARRILGLENPKGCSPITAARELLVNAARQPPRW